MERRSWWNEAVCCAQLSRRSVCWKNVHDVMGSGHCNNTDDKCDACCAAACGVSSVGGECGAKSGQPVDLSVDDDAVFQEWPPHSFSLALQVADTEHETGEALTREVETTLQLSHLTPDSPSGWMSLPTDAAEHDTRWKVQFRCAVAGDVGVELRCARCAQYPAAV